MFHQPIKVLFVVIHGGISSPKAWNSGQRCSRSITDTLTRSGCWWLIWFALRDCFLKNKNQSCSSCRSSLTGVSAQTLILFPQKKQQPKKPSRFCFVFFFLQLTGIILQAAKRLQVNVLVQKIPTFRFAPCRRLFNKTVACQSTVKQLCHRHHFLRTFGQSHQSPVMRWLGSGRAGGWWGRHWFTPGSSRRAEEAKVPVGYFKCNKKTLYSPFSVKQEMWGRWSFLSFISMR